MFRRVSLILLSTVHSLLATARAYYPCCWKEGRSHFCGQLGRGTCSAGGVWPGQQQRGAGRGQGAGGTAAPQPEQGCSAGIDWHSGGRH